MNDTKGRAPGTPDSPEGGEPPRGGILMGRPFGVPVYVTPSWFLVAALITWIFGSRLADVLPGLGATRYLLAFSFAVAFYGSVLVHELAHTVVGLRYKLGVRRIQLQFLGGVSEIEKEADRPWREFWLALVGPLLSLVLAGVFWAGLSAVEPATVPGVLLAGLMISNLVVAAFNLLPGLPLDGGRMLRAVVWAATGDPMKGTVAAVWTGRALAVAVVLGLPVLGAAQNAERSTGEAMLDGVLAAILGFIIWQGAGNSLRNARLKEVLPGLKVRDLARRSIDVTSDTPLGEALRRAHEAHAGAIVVVDGRGEPTGLVKESAVTDIPEHRRPWVAVSAVARDLQPGHIVPVDLAGEQILETLRRAPASEYLVVRADGSVYGVLSLADLERRLTAALLGRPTV
ncbi:MULTISPECIES: site-2 protease family protein [Kitasatospora]|uniref:site-2 protease family protein n=1 Tax=Kitasatospora TaxID=2063 RepID=UPI000C26F174|nr:site-2 protease family protein [Kitasatospora sp. CB02891]PJN29702.1 site-2 protease family protein [Kitasatospora sp. CB02891]